MENPGIRLDQVIKSMKMSRLKFAKETSIAQSFLNEIVNGKKNISINSLEKIRNRYPLVNIHWLLTGHGSMYLNQLKDTPAEVGEPISPYKARYINNVLPSDDGPIRRQLGSNLDTLIHAWGMKKIDFFSMLIPGVQKQVVTNYLKGISQPPLFALIHLERLTGITVVDWLTNSIPAAIMPNEPREFGIIHRNGNTSKLIEDIKKVLEKYSE
jgi:transcriptional regulator with XRE-family HTH domain